jgi:hypothetical protein
MKTARQMMYGNAPLPSVDAAPGGGGTPAPPTEWTGGVQPPAVPQRTHNLPPRDPATGQFTEADLIAAREQAAREVEERLTGRLGPLEEQLRTLTTEREAMMAEQQRVQQEAAAAAEAQRQAELSAVERLAEQQQQFAQQQAQFQADLAARDALFQREQQYQALQDYKNRRLNEERALIAPQFDDFIVGNSPEEIESSITAVKAKTDDIAQMFGQQQQTFRQQQRGVAPTGMPPIGPMDNAPGQTLVSASDLDAMDNATYAANREVLLAAARRSGPYGQGR